MLAKPTSSLRTFGLVVGQEDLLDQSLLVLAVIRAVASLLVHLFELVLVQGEPQPTQLLDEECPWEPRRIYGCFHGLFESFALLRDHPALGQFHVAPLCGIVWQSHPHAAQSFTRLMPRRPIFGDQIHQPVG